MFFILKKNTRYWKKMFNEIKYKSIKVIKKNVKLIKPQISFHE